MVCARRFKERMNFFKQNVPQVIKIQAAYKGMYIEGSAVLCLDPELCSFAQLLS